jgi:DNA-binding transcriptional LysR family regulator
VHASLLEIDRGVDELGGHRRRRRIAPTAAASLASLMPVPRLPDFSRRSPGVDLRIDALDVVRDLEAEGIDIAIRSHRHERAPRVMPSFTHQALDAALREQGVMLAPTIHAREHLAGGSLIAPIGLTIRSGWGYDLVVNRDSARLRHVGAFVEWLTGLFDEPRTRGT